MANGIAGGASLDADISAWEPEEFATGLILRGRKGEQDDICSLSLCTQTPGDV